MSLVIFCPKNCGTRVSFFPWLPRGQDTAFSWAPASARAATKMKVNKRKKPSCKLPQLLLYGVRKIFERLMSSKLITFKCSDSNRMIASTMLHVNLCNRFTLTTIWILRTGSDEEMMKFRCRNCLWCWSFIFEVSCATLWPIRKSQNLGDRFASRPWRKLEEQSGCLKKMMEKGALNWPKSWISGKTANTSKWWWILRWISRMRTVLDVKTGHYPQAWFAASVAPWGSAMTQATGAK